MSDLSREDRLRADLETMRALQLQSNILDFTTENDPPDRYQIVFRGKGVNCGTSHDATIEIVELHRVELRLPYSYPQNPPDIRWQTSIYHPNISYSGLLKLRDIGLPWEPGLGLDVVCERLWDVTRLAFVDMNKACNYAARNWLDDQEEITLPVDQRPLRDKTAPSGSNVIQYHRKQTGGVDLPDSAAADELFVIDENTPVPDMPQASPRRSRSRNDDEDVFYIGDE